MRKAPLGTQLRYLLAGWILPARHRRMLMNRGSEALAAVSAALAHNRTDEQLHSTRLEKLVRAYGEIIWVYVCVKKNGQTLSAVPLRARNGEEDLGDTHPLVKLLKRPNRFQSRQEFVNTVDMSRDLTGEAFLQLDRGPSGTGTPQAIYCLPIFDEDSMTVVPNRNLEPTEDGYIEGYIYRVRGQEIPFLASEIIHIKEPNPFNPLRGLSPLRAGAMSTELEKSSKQYNLALFRNSARLEGHWESEDGISETKRKRLEKLLNARFKGAKNVGKRLLMSGVKFVSTQLPPKDVEWLLLQRLDREEILPLFGVRPVVVGLLEHNPQANAEVQWKDYYQATIQPNGSKITDKFNIELAPLFGESLKVYFDWSSVSVLQEDFNAKVETAFQLHRMNVPFNRINERLDLGFAPLPWGDTVLVSPLLMPIESIAQTTPAKLIDVETTRELESGGRELLLPAAEEIPIRASQSMSKETIEKLKILTAKRFNLRQDNFEKRYARPIKDFFQAQQLRTLRRFREETRMDALEHLRAEPASVDLSLVFPSLEEIDRMAKEPNRKIIRETMIESMITFVLDHGGAEDDLNLVSEEILNFIDQESFRQAKFITETTRDLLAVELKEALDAGESIPQIAGRIERVFIRRASSATTIARTETGAAANFGNHESAAQTKAKSKAWSHSGDSRVRESHRWIGAQDPIPISAPFVLPNGAKLMFPNDGSLGAGAEDVCNCRCTTLYMFD